MAGNVETVHTSKDVWAALNDAQRLAREGAYEQALERHVWYHKNALKYAPEHFGVKLSFALMYWVQLGEVYPPALDALRSARDDTLAALRKDSGDPLMLLEVMSINMRLDDLMAAKALFYEFPEDGASALSHELDRILAAGETEWAHDIVGNPEKRFKDIRQRWETMRTALADSPYLSSVADSCSSEIVNLIEGVAKVHGLEGAKEIQREALLILNSPAIREALDDI